MTPIRRTAGVWGPLIFAGTVVAAARRQDGYSHIGHHISGLGASGQRSAAVMIPGFMALGASTLMMPVPSSKLAKLARVAGLGVIAAGIIPVSQPRCPQPGTDPEATASDLGHGVASVAAFAAWTAIPFVTFASGVGPSWYRSLNQVLRVTTAVGFVGAAATTRLDAAFKGLAQRAFLGSVFTWYAATAARSAFTD